MTNMQALKTFFESDNGRKLGMDEIKALSKEDRDELASLALVALGEAITTK